MPEGHTIHRLALDHVKDLAGRQVRVQSPQGRFEGTELVDGGRFIEPEGDQLTLDLVGPTACALLSQKEHRALIARLGPDPLRADADPLRGHG